MSMDSPKQLFEDYLYWRAMTAYCQVPSFYKQMKLTPAREQLMLKMSDWAVERRIDPRRWLWGLHELRSWRFPPVLSSSHIMSVKIIPKYERLTDDSRFQKKLLEDQHQKDLTKGRQFDPNRDVHPTIEGIKRRYLEAGDAGAVRCMSQMYEQTLGYHPISRVCIRCPLWQQCLNRLERTTTFDILALREGRLSADSAQAQAARRDVWWTQMTSFPSAMSSNPASYD